MSDDPKQGVVDANCKVHGISNLYMSGSSCFVTAAAPNPTLTLIALTLRLSDYIKKKISSRK
jgi:choline dehydrogenase-like flavoprotein